MESNNDQTPVSDEDRRLAEAKKLILQPLHGNIAPEPVSDTEIAARHLADPAIGNAGSDIEQDAQVIQPSKGLLDTRKTSSLKKWSIPFVITVILSTGFIFGVAYLVLSK